MDDLLKLFFGFLLTTVFGGALGYYFQNRAWRHQFHIRLLEAELASATKLFEELSRLMDKRLYRMRQVHWKLKQHASGEIVEEHMNGYRGILCEWNDALNRNLALTETFFGSDIKSVLEGSIYEEFSRIGQILEAGYLKVRDNREDYGWKQTAADLTELGHRIYNLNVRMIRSIQQRQQGLSRSEIRLGKKSNRGAAPNPGPQADSYAAA
jgi:hypothetical protein